MWTGVHLDLDGAWNEAPIRAVDAKAWGPKLRYLAKSREIYRFSNQIANGLPPYVLYGSGDFHHLAAIFLRKVAGPVTVVSFDNHPDWDIRPPRWACGSWVNRALEMPNVMVVSVWGCGNFELSFPSRVTANRRALRSGRLQVHGWADRQSAPVQRRFTCMTLDEFRGRFLTFAKGLRGNAVYVTVDLDCLRAEEAITQWENGLFTAADVAWAIGQLREQAQVVGGDLCGAWSEPVYARRFQRFAAWWDHPRLQAIDPMDTKRINAASLAMIWPVLTGERSYTE